MKRRLVSNTGPLVALALVERLDILESLFETTTIPEAVHEEILEGGAINAGVRGYRGASLPDGSKLPNSTQDSPLAGVPFRQAPRTGCS